MFLLNNWNWTILKLVLRKSGKTIGKTNGRKTQWENHGTFWVKWLGSNLMPRPRRVTDGMDPWHTPRNGFRSWTWNPIHRGKTNLNHKTSMTLDLKSSFSRGGLYIYRLQVVMEERNVSWDSSLTCECLRFLCFIAFLLLLLFLWLLVWFLCSLHKYDLNCLVSFANITILPTKSVYEYT